MEGFYITSKFNYFKTLIFRDPLALAVDLPLYSARVKCWVLSIGHKKKEKYFFGHLIPATRAPLCYCSSPFQIHQDL